MALRIDKRFDDHSQSTTEPMLGDLIAEIEADAAEREARTAHRFQLTIKLLIIGWLIVVCLFIAILLAVLL